MSKNALEIRWKSRIIKCHDGDRKLPASHITSVIVKDPGDKNGDCLPSHEIFQGDVEKKVKGFLSQDREKCLNDLIESREDQELFAPRYGSQDSLHGLCRAMWRTWNQTEGDEIQIICFLDEAKEGNTETANFTVSIPYWLSSALTFSRNCAAYKISEEQHQNRIFWHSMIPLAAGIIGGIVTSGVCINLLINSGLQAVNAAFQSGDVGVYVGLAVLALGLIAFSIMKHNNKKRENKADSHICDKKNTFLSHHDSPEKSAEYSEKDKLDSDCTFGTI